MKQNHKIGFAIAIILAIASWIISIYYWDKLPNIIPVHFGLSSQADSWADKSLFYVFSIPTLQSLMLISFIFLYKKPQYSNMPTTLWLIALGEKQREHAFGLIRVMLIGTALWVGILFTYITYSMDISAIDKDLGLSPWVMITLVLLMIIWSIFWSVKVVNTTRQAIKSIKLK